MRSFVWSGRPQYYTDEPSWQTWHPLCSKMTCQDGHRRPRWWPGGPVGLGTELSAPSPSATRSPGRFANLGSSCLGEAAQKQRLQSWIGSRAANGAWRARCLPRGRHGFGSRRAVHRSNDPKPLFRHHNEVPPWSTSTAISAFQGKALIAKQSALQVRYNSRREIWRAVLQCFPRNNLGNSAVRSSETNPWKSVRLVKWTEPHWREGLQQGPQLISARNLLFGP